MNTFGNSVVITNAARRLLLNPQHPGGNGARETEADGEFTEGTQAETAAGAAVTGPAGR